MATSLPILATSPSGTATEIAIPLRVLGRSSSATYGRPLSVSVPFPQSLVHDGDWCVRVGEATIACDSRVLAHWFDGSIRWLQVALPVDAWQAEAELTLVRRSDEAVASKVQLNIEQRLEQHLEGTLEQNFISTGTAQFTLLSDATDFLRYSPPPIFGAESVFCLHLTDAQGSTHDATIESWWDQQKIGDAITKLYFQGRFGKRTALRWEGNVSFYAGSSQVRLEITIQNPQRAKHPDGYWDLGDPGSILVRDLTLELATTLNGPRQIEWRTDPTAPLHETNAERWEIYQESSGGEFWNSANHVNRLNEVPLRLRGYRVRYEQQEQLGERASPIVALKSSNRYVACAVEDFWQKFPTAIEIEQNKLSIRLWPGQFPDLHELQGGEHNTRVIWFDFGGKTEVACEKLADVYDPPRVIVDAAWVAASGCVPHLPPPELQYRPEFQSLLNEAIAGSQSFFAKREAIDEFGWRNFGDMWADHEAAYAEDPRPVISHYNNQYDLLHGLIIQYLRSHDSRWWKLAEPLARHVMDIDIYHTQRDKAGYNGGLFWHTAHYHAVGSATHSCMSNSMQGKKIPAPGAGPCNEHNYSSGLLLYHYLTGSAVARQTVIGMAEWVIAMDDGTRHILGVASNLPTGHASSTADPDYHGPGRGAGNSIVSLLNGWQLTNDERFIAKAIELIRRCIHPHDDLTTRQLHNAEMRWSYTVFLHALVRFLEATAHRHDLVEAHGYAQASLLHYARWMAEHEKFYLDEPEKLEYPTETWAAQELRKGTSLFLAARYTNAEEAMRFRVRGQAMLDRAWESLMSFESRACTRPLALVLQQGYLETSLRDPQSFKGGQLTLGQAPLEFGEPEVFIHQRRSVKSALKSPVGWIRMLGCAVRPARWLNVMRQSWLWERMRQRMQK